jgi:hypothetical protein
MTRKELGDTLEVSAPEERLCAGYPHHAKRDLGTLMVFPMQGIGGLPCGPLRNVGEAYKDEQALHRGMVQKVQHPKAGELPLAGVGPGTYLIPFFVPLVPSHEPARKGSLMADLAGVTQGSP